MRLVVTGLSGNLGTALLRALAAGERPFPLAEDSDRPDAEPGGAGYEPVEVVGVVRRPPPPRGPYTAARWVGLDLTAPTAARDLRAVLDGADSVVHLAWGFQPSHDVGYLERLGVGGSAAVLEAADAVGVPHLVHMSSLGAYAPGPARTTGRDGPPLRRVDESWPHTGVATSAYSRHKAAAEQRLDVYEASGGRTAVTRLRPALVLQPDAGSALLRYGAPGWLPARAVRALPLLPLDRRLVLQAVHADDVAAAVLAALRRRATGAFNLAAEPPLDRDDLATALGAHPVHLASAVLGALVEWSWRAHLQPLDRGWIDLAFAVPLMDTGRARRELGWSPTVDAFTALSALVDAMARAQGTASPVLRPRSLADDARRLVTAGPVSLRRKP